MANVSIALARTNAFAKMDGLDKIVKKKWKCVRWQHVKMMQTVSIYSKITSVCVQKEPMVNSVRWVCQKLKKKEKNCEQY